MGVKNIRQIERKAPSAREMLVAPFSLSALSLPPLSLFGGLSVLDDVTAKNAVSKGKGRRGREHADDDQRVAFRTRDRLLILLWRSALAERVGLHWRPNSNLRVDSDFLQLCHYLGLFFEKKISTYDKSVHAFTIRVFMSLS